MPASTLREHAGTRTREPSTSTTQTRQTLTGVSVSSWQSVGVSMRSCRQASRIVAPSSTSISWPSMLTLTSLFGRPTNTGSWGPRELTAQPLSSLGYPALSTLSCVSPDAIALAAVWPRPQIDASRIACAMSLSRLTSESREFPFRSLSSRCSTSSCRTVPTRHGAAGGGAAPAAERPKWKLTRFGCEPAERHRAGDARRVNLRPGPDRGERDRIRAHTSQGAQCRITPRTQRLRREFAGTPRAGIRRPTEEARQGEHRRPGDGCARGRDDPRCLPAASHRHADALPARDVDPGQRLPGLRSRGGGFARPGPRVLAQGRGGHEDPDGLGARPSQPPPRARAPSVIGRHVAVLAAGPWLDAAVRRDPRALRRKHRHGGAAGEDRPRPLCPR